MNLILGFLAMHLARRNHSFFYVQICLNDANAACYNAMPVNGLISKFRKNGNTLVSFVIAKKKLSHFRYDYTMKFFLNNKNIECKLMHTLRHAWHRIPIVSQMLYVRKIEKSAFTVSDNSLQLFARTTREIFLFFNILISAVITIYGIYNICIFSG